MIEISKHMVINCPAEEMIPVLTRVEHLRRWMPGFISAKHNNEGPIVVGSKYNQIFKVGSTQVKMDFEVTGLQEGKKFVVRGSSNAFYMTGAWTFNSVLRGTEVYYFSNISIDHWLFKYFKPFFKKTLILHHENYFARFKNYLESLVQKRMDDKRKDSRPGRRPNA